jgi:hypothetical protein
MRAVILGQDGKELHDGDHRKVEAHTGAGLGTTGTEGAIRQAFQSSLRRELSSLFQLLAVLESMASQPLPSKGERSATWHGGGNKRRATEFRPLLTTVGGGRGGRGGVIWV